MTVPEPGSMPGVSPAEGREGIAVRRLPVQFHGDERHVVHLPLIPVGGRVRSLLARVGRLPEEQVESVLEETMASYGTRHLDLMEAFETRYRDAAALVDAGTPGSHSRQRRRRADAARVQAACLSQRRDLQSLLEGDHPGDGAALRGKPIRGRLADR